MFRLKDLFLTFPILGWINSQLNRFLTLGGKIIFVAMFFFAAGASHLDSPVYMLCGASISLLFVSYLATLYFRPELDIEIQPPEILSIGCSMPMEIRTSNIGKKSANELQIVEHPDDKSGTKILLPKDAPKNIQCIQPNSTATNYLPMTASRRGIFQCPSIRIRSAYPFNLIHTTQKYQGRGQTAVVPKHAPLLSCTFITETKNSVSGDHNKSIALAQQEFIGSREYVPGIDAKRWDHAAWARHATPYVCQFDDEGTRNAVLIFDNFQREYNERKFEASLSLLLSMAHALHENGYSIDVLKIGNSVLDLPVNSTDRQIREISICIASARPVFQPNISANEKNCWGVNYLTVEIANEIDTKTNSLNQLSPKHKFVVQHENDSKNLDRHFQSVTVENIESGTIRL